jgi:protein-S-isoprenylcysteine O-methyltransferase Ste14
LLFAAGYIINRQSDGILRGLRRPGESGYKVTDRGFYRWVSCPNYLGEVVIWLGWALATWSPAGLVFAAWTVANLVPRAKANHAWYRANFPDYPPNRKALVPGIW